VVFHYDEIVWEAVDDMHVFLWLVMAIMALYRHEAALAADVQITVSDATPYHAHPPGEPFYVDVRIIYPGSATISCQWQDFEGNPLGEPVVLTPSLTHTLTSPSNQVGYYELVFKANSRTVALADRDPGQTREYGFVVLPTVTVADRNVDPASPFGVVHADINDPHLTGWIKTITWNSTNAKWWGYEIDERRKRGLIELPMVVGSGCTTDNSSPITAAELGVLQSRILSFFASDPEVLHWELGIEENLRNDYGQSFYWQNLVDKADAVRTVADAVNPDIKLIYQVVGTTFEPGGPIELFLSSEAAETFDILSLHPYRWPDFSTPDTWLEALIEDIAAYMKTHGVAMPIWLTEVGAPHHGNAGGFFGYPSSGRQVIGLTRARAAAYMIKIHVIALHAGVERVFWYNYVDRGSGLQYAEDHFGLVDYWGYPKAVYAAYHNLHSKLEGKIPTRSEELPDGVRVFEFAGQNENTFVAWVHPPAERTVPLSFLQPNLIPSEKVSAVNAVGTPVPISGGAVALSATPVFVTSAPRVSATPARRGWTRRLPDIAQRRDQW